MSNKLSLVVLISGNGSNLQSIIDAIESGQLNAEIKAVISNQPFAQGLVRAHKHGLASRIIDHKEFSDRAAFDLALIELLNELSADFIILAGFMRILGSAVVNHFENKIINIHPSLLPAYKGLNTYQRAIDNQEQEHGVSIHLVNAELDAGAVIMQGRYPIEAGDTEQDLRNKGVGLEHKMYPALIQALCEREICIEPDRVLYKGQALQRPIGFSIEPASA